MEPERWRQIEEIVQAALDCRLENRPALIEAACGGDPELRREVDSLLEAQDSGGFTGSPVFADAMAALERRDANLNEGRRIGAYRLLREIGRGGMGAVYLAARDDDAFQKLVAIKIIRRGLDTDDILRRFRTERQILALLDHPNIARLLDGGTTDDGLPYFVMEYIEGEPIDTYCDGRKLGVPERLKLFQGVCAAVRYAHQNLIIHRDIKPGNVLVTKDGVPRLLDFGIAKVVAPGTPSGNDTLTVLRPLTPEYASPEQVRGDALTTSSDVYSLGVLLYRLLTGRRPYRQPMSSPAEIERSICEEEARKPSAAVAGKARRRLKGDLDNIVLMALRKEPRRRYASAEQLSEDIKRHLAGFPVSARPDTWSYRAAKFVHRHKAWVAAAALIFLTLVGGIAATLREARVARLEQAKAARINAFLQDIVGYSSVSPATPSHRANATVADLLDDAARRVDTELADQPEVKAEMLGTIGGTYLNQARYDLARRYLQQAYDLDLKLYGSNARQTAQVMNLLANLCYLTGDYSTAASWFQKAVPVYRRLRNRPDLEVRLLVGMLSDAAFVQRALGRPDEAEALWREALTYGPRMPARYRGQAIVPKTFLAQLYMDRGDVARADPLAAEAVRELRAFGGDSFSLAQALIDLGNVRRLEGRYAEAESSIQEGTSLYAKVQGEKHPNVIFGLAMLAMSRYGQGKYELAEQDARRALKIAEQLPNKRGPYYIGVNSVLGLILNKAGRPREAEPLLREVLAVRLKSAPRSNGYVAAALGSLGECLAAQKRYAEAEPLLVESYTTLKSVQVPQSPTLKQARERVVALYTAWEKPSEAARYRQ